MKACGLVTGPGAKRNRIYRQNQLPAALNVNSLQLIDELAQTRRQFGPRLQVSLLWRSPMASQIDTILSYDRICSEVVVDLGIHHPSLRVPPGSISQGLTDSRLGQVTTADGFRT